MPRAPQPIAGQRGPRGAEPQPLASRPPAAVAVTVRGVVEHESPRPQMCALEGDAGVASGTGTPWPAPTAPAGRWGSVRPSTTVNSTAAAAAPLSTVRITASPPGTTRATSTVASKWRGSSGCLRSSRRATVDAADRRCRVRAAERTSSPSEASRQADVRPAPRAALREGTCWSASWRRCAGGRRPPRRRSRGGSPATGARRARASGRRAEVRGQPPQRGQLALARGDARLERGEVGVDARARLPSTQRDGRRRDGRR